MTLFSSQRAKNRLLPLVIANQPDAWMDQLCDLVLAVQPRTNWLSCRAILHDLS